MVGKKTAMKRRLQGKLEDILQSTKIALLEKEFDERKIWTVHVLRQGYTGEELLISSMPVNDIKG